MVPVVYLYPPEGRMWPIAVICKGLGVLEVPMGKRTPVPECWFSRADARVDMAGAEGLCCGEGDHCPLLPLPREYPPSEALSLSALSFHFGASLQLSLRKSPTLSDSR